MISFTLFQTCLAIVGRTIKADPNLRHKPAKSLATLRTSRWKAWRVGENVLELAPQVSTQ